MRQLLALAALIALAVACGDEFTAAGGDGGAGGSGGSTGPCDSPSDCPAPGWCVQATCEDHVCGTTPRPVGAVLPDTQQTEGDCQVVSCDGAGQVVSEDDPSDLPDDDNPCTDDRCNNGTPSNVPMPTNTPCGEEGMYCDNTGTCVGCTQASQCPGEDTDCAWRTCNGGVCGTDVAAADTKLTHQVPGDCQDIVCDGEGAETPQDNDLDEPADDPTDCVDTYCESGDLVTEVLDTPTHCGGSDDRVCCDGQCCLMNQLCSGDVCTSAG